MRLLEDTLYWLMCPFVYLCGPIVKWSPQELSSIPILTEVFKGIYETPITSRRLLWLYLRNRELHIYEWVWVLLMVRFEELPKSLRNADWLTMLVIKYRLELGK